MANTIRGLLPDGTLPSAALAQVQGMVDDLDIPEPAVQGVPIFETLAEAQAWEAENPGKIALTLEGQEPAEPYQAPAPVADDVLDTITLPDDPWAEYLIGGEVVTGTYSVGNVDATVVVTARAKGDRELVGDTMWPFTFSRAAGYRVVASSTFTHPDGTPLSGMPLDVGGAFATVTENYSALVQGGKAVYNETALARISGQYGLATPVEEPDIRAFRWTAAYTTARLAGKAARMTVYVDEVLGGADYDGILQITLRNGETAEVSANPRITLDSTEAVTVPLDGEIIVTVEGRTLTLSMGGVVVTEGTLSYDLSPRQRGRFSLAGGAWEIDDWTLEVGV